MTVQIAGPLQAQPASPAGAAAAGAAARGAGAGCKTAAPFGGSPSQDLLAGQKTSSSLPDTAPVGRVARNSGADASAVKIPSRPSGATDML